jgi:hypothetical protein
MSMVLYVICLHPFLNFLNRKMARITTGNRIRPTAAVAYADGVTNTTDTIRGIEYYQAVTIKSVTFWGTTRQSMDDTLARLTGKFRIQAKKA